MIDERPECLSCRVSIKDGEYDFCRECLAKAVQHNLDEARWYWERFSKYRVELDSRNQAVGKNDMEMAKTIQQMPEYMKGYPRL